MDGDVEQDIFGGAGVESLKVKGKADDKDSDEDEVPTKKMASMSLAARVKMKFGDKSSAPPAVRRRFRFLFDYVCCIIRFGCCYVVCLRSL